MPNPCQKEKKITALIHRNLGMGLSFEIKHKGSEWEDYIHLFFK